FEQQIPLRSWRVRLDAQGRLEWQGGAGNPAPIHHTEPESRWFERAWLRLLGWLPIEWLL
ncbi:MAG: phospholipase D family protein, partial [Comamonas sp.]